MKILGIETSCDETSIAVVEDGTKVHSCIISSSQKDFESLGGVVPENAARMQLECIFFVLEKAVHTAGVSLSDCDAIAVTNTPGLLGSLLVGTSVARVLSAIHKLPLIPVHHTLGHLSSVWLSMESACLPTFPCLTLSVSGGHTDLWYRESHTNCRRIGATRDDAVGEAFDKGAVQLGLPYPGGPKLSQLADGGVTDRYAFPFPLAHEQGFDFSFSGLKTSLKYLLRDAGGIHSLSEIEKKDLAASYEYALCAHLLDRVSKALDEFPQCQELHMVGGVSANRQLRLLAKELGRQKGVDLRLCEELRYCTDNGAMIAAAGYFLFKEKPSCVSSSWQTSSSSSLEELLMQNAS